MCQDHGCHCPRIDPHSLNRPPKRTSRCRSSCQHGTGPHTLQCLAISRSHHHAAYRPPMPPHISSHFHGCRFPCHELCHPSRNHHICHHLHVENFLNLQLDHSATVHRIGHRRPIPGNLGPLALLRAIHLYTLHHSQKCVQDASLCL